MNIFCTGITGTVGSQLIPLLIKEHNITAVSRREIEIEGVTMIRGDTTEQSSWMDHVVNADVIINLAGENIFANRWSRKRRQILIDSRVKTTSHIVKAMNSVNRPQRLISISGVDYYPINRQSKEYDGPGDNFLAQLCKQWEAPIKELKENKESLILRMGVSFGYGLGGAERMFMTHNFHIGGWIGSGKQIYSWIHIKDFAGIVAWAVSSDLKGIMNCVAGNIEMKEIAKVGGKLLGRRTWTWAPGLLLSLVLGKRAVMLLKGRKVSNEKLLQSGYKLQFPDIRNTLEDIFIHSKHFSLK